MGISLTTAERVDGAGWWPTRGDAERKLFLGNEACKPCHRGLAITQETTAMFQTGKHGSQSTVLNAHPALDFHEGEYNAGIRLTEEGAIYSVSDGRLSTVLRASWAFGSPQKGQTYLLQQDKAYYESRLSYFVNIDGLDVTLGQPASVPPDLESAKGRKLQADELRRCFGCHTTASMASGAFSPEDAMAGVTCEACHGPGARHVERMKAGQSGRAPGSIFDPGSLSPVESVDFCGACHRTWADVVEMPGSQGVLKIRSQPYRLEQSRCWGEKGDARLTCVACHDPHQPLVRVAEAYDPKCLACHSQRAAQGSPGQANSVCKVATRGCVTCHMPQYPVAQVHGSFTDHQIRIVQRTGLQ